MYISERWFALTAFFPFIHSYLVASIKMNGWVKLWYGHEKTLFCETLVHYSTSGHRCELDYPMLPLIFFSCSLSLARSPDHKRKKSLSFSLFINTPSPSSSLQIGTQTFRFPNFVGRSEKKSKAGWLCVLHFSASEWQSKEQGFEHFDQTHGYTLWHDRIFWWVLSVFWLERLILIMFLLWKKPCLD